MLLKYFYDRYLAQASYLVGCQQTGEAIVIDPARDIVPYLEAARAEGVRITHVTETHIHADFVSGSRELAAAANAKLLLSGMGGPEWQYGFAQPDTTLLKEGDCFWVGNVRVDVLHTPGHTPEHLVFMITDTKAASKPMGLFTGDCLFVGDIGRPDLLETAAGFAGTKEKGAREQFQNIQRLKALPDYLQIWPGHGAGSACGKALGSVPSSTLGYEKLFNPAFQFEDEAAFVRWLLDGQPETPRYFAQMKRVNRQGPALLSELSAPEPLEGFLLADVLREEHLVIDARHVTESTQHYIPGTVIIPPREKFSSYAGWVIDYDRPTYLIAPSSQIDHLVGQLRTIGVDQIAGYFPAEALGEIGEIFPQMTAEEAAAQLGQPDVLLLDVRGQTEFAEERAAGARNILYGRILEMVDELPHDGKIIVQCATGNRSLIAASLLQNRGFKNVYNQIGGLKAWRAASLPVETEGIKTAS